MRKIYHNVFDDTRNDILAEIHNRLAEISKFLEVLACEKSFSSSMEDMFEQEIPRIERVSDYYTVTEGKNG